MSSTTTETGHTQQPVLHLGRSQEESSADVDIISGLHVIPKFTDKYAERKWAKEQMAAAFRLWAKLGYNDGAGGHISLRDPVDPSCFWISKSPFRAEPWTNLAVKLNAMKPVMPLLDVCIGSQESRT
jgi:hypothetical protein